MEFLLSPNIRTHEIAKKVSDFATSLGYVVAPGLYGHGTGVRLHESPSLGFSREDLNTIPNIKLVENMVITIEPVICHTSSQG